MLKINYKLGVFDMDTKKIGIAIIVVGLSLCVMFIDSYKYLVSALTVVILGFLITLIGYLADVKKQKFINDKLNEDIERIIQPLITKYSNLNKQYSSQYDGEEYIQKRMEINRNLEKELTENLPYLESRQIKKSSLISVRNRTNYNFFSNILKCTKKYNKDLNSTLF